MMRWVRRLLSGLLVALVGSLLAALVLAQTEPPTPRMPPIPDRLAPPPMPENPTQADLGAHVYYQVCMACHGDRGQGLTEEWRNVLDPADRNCWQRGCHHSVHPEGGFIFPQIVPSVVSPGMVARFETALDLYNFIRADMPWQAPGSLSDEQYWQLTAFLLRLNGINDGKQSLDAETAARIPMRLALQEPAGPPEEDFAYWYAAAALIALFLGALIWIGIWRVLRRRSVKTMTSGSG